MQPKLIVWRQCSARNRKNPFCRTENVKPNSATNDFAPIADVYDELVSWVPYTKWVRDLEKRLRAHGLRRDHPILDAACGSGLSTLPWVELGYRVVGVDRCPELLKEARKKVARADSKVTFQRQDLLHLRLGPQFGAAVCMHSGLDYILDDEDLMRAFQSLREALVTGGLLAFDKCLDQPEFYQQECTHVRELSCGTAMFHYKWDREHRLFVQRCTVIRKADGREVSRSEVLHLMKATPLDALIGMVERAGFKLLETPRQFGVSDPGMGIFRAL